MQKHRNITVERLEKFVQSGQFEDVNFRSLLWKARTSETVKLQVFAVPDLKRIPFDEAIKGDFKPAQITVDVPKEFAGEEIIFNFDPESEGMVWSLDGMPLQGLTGGNGGDRHVDYRLTKAAKGGERFEFYIETAANGMFGNAPGINPPTPDRYYKLALAEIAVPNNLAFAVWYDFEILLGMVKELPRDSQPASDALYTANKIVNTIWSNKPDTLVEAHMIAREFFSLRAKTGYSAHEITAIGHCHIDTAWLWPYDETKRKVARSFSTQISYMNDYPDFKFAASQAQQYEWLEQLYPKLFEELKKKVKAGQFVPWGGTWVEMDCNLPSGESFCRQFLYGQRYFESRFGERSDVFALPDTFGYSSQLPQIVKQSDVKYFFTQKLSWNNINKFPHTTFIWTGIDGTSVLTHFSPADTYVAQGTVRDVAFSVTNNKDREYSNKSLLLFGNGDGGGGPLKPMIERLKRLKNVEGLPATVKFGSPNDFYRELEATSRDLVSWKGELYFELHRGTFTSQALTKKYNRKSEFLLRDVELFSSLATILKKGYTLPKAELDRLWKLVLLCQFHDVLPGSSIEMVYEDSTRFYRDVEKSGKKMLEDAVGAFIEGLTSGGSFAQTEVAQAVAGMNTTSWPVSASLVELDHNILTKAGAKGIQQTADGKALVFVNDIPGMSVRSFALSHGLPAGLSAMKVESLHIVPHELVTDDDYVQVEQVEKVILVENSYIRVKFDSHGRVLSLLEKATNREAIKPSEPANRFMIYEDIPLYWDAWDVEVYHMEKGFDAGMDGTLSIEEFGPLRVVLKVTHQITKTSKLSQRIIITTADAKVDFETKIEWDENRKILKVEFPFNVNCDYATYETQFGYIQRPTHYNNSWDMARFEVCGHKFADLSEYGFGVAVFNDCKYGYSCKDSVMRLSLLRAPKAPDLHCDIGTHEFKYALYPHKGTFYESDVVQKAYQYNSPPIVRPLFNSSSESINKLTAGTQFFSVDMENVVLDTVKIAEDPRGNGTDLVLRFYESMGGRGTVHFTTTLPVKEANHCNVLEDIGEKVEKDEDGKFVFEVTPFKIVSLRLLFA
ncbi:Glycoside hydrolase, 38 vacuolar alpha mannosidase [Chytridiales sp. JEL 0842]|nr:Glycoside hydrolase, 38 vacuolar alpha mannosidase [Chytridiales sp. JEL 0842]